MIGSLLSDCLEMDFDFDEAKDFSFMILCRDYIVLICTKHIAHQSYILKSKQYEITCKIVLFAIMLVYLNNT